MRTLSLLAISLFLAVAIGGLAQANPPEGVPIDPQVHAWFENLVRADGYHCCSAADCRLAKPGELRASAQGLQVLLDGEWIDVPEHLVVHRDYSPIGGSVICKTRYGEGDQMPNALYCVVPFTGL
jgi:hypothetical protein